MDENYSAAVGKRIHILRRERHWTQEELASKLQILDCNLTRSAIAKIEVGQRHIYPDELKALQMVFQVQYEALLP